MRKYIRKGKIAGVEVSVMEPPLSGVHTRARAKTLASLQRSMSPRSSTKSLKRSPSSSSTASSSCYIQLRSRRLEKCSPASSRRGWRGRRSAFPSSAPKEEAEEVKCEKDAGVEASFGENALEGEENGSRSSRETAPCSVIRRDSETIGTLCSTNRPPSTRISNRMIQNSLQKNISTSREMEEFFSVPEKRQQQAFAVKYNFDPARDRPLAGRYEWVKLDN